VILDRTTSLKPFWSGGPKQITGKGRYQEIHENKTYYVYVKFEIHDGGQPEPTDVYTGGSFPPLFPPFLLLPLGLCPYGAWWRPSGFNSQKHLHCLFRTMLNLLHRHHASLQRGKQRESYSRLQNGPWSGPNSGRECVIGSRGTSDGVGQYQPCPSYKPCRQRACQTIRSSSYHLRSQRWVKSWISSASLQASTCYSGNIHLRAVRGFFRRNRGANSTGGRRGGIPIGVQLPRDNNRVGSGSRLGLRLGFRSTTMFPRPPAGKRGGGAGGIVRRETKRYFDFHHECRRSEETSYEQVRHSAEGKRPTIDVRAMDVGK
jgi:hypothetical protein